MSVLVGCFEEKKNQSYGLKMERKGETWIFLPLETLSN